MDADILIEKAQLQDINDILNIENLCFESDQFSKQQFIYLITRAKGVFYILKLKQKVVAYISLLTNKRTNNLRIYSIAVHPETRGKSLAQMLINKAIEYACQKNIKTISLEVKLNNIAAISLYEKNGFKNYSIKQNYYHDGCNANVMLLKLSYQ